MTTRETILGAIATVLASVASGRVYRARFEQLPTLPAVVIEPASETAEENFIGVMDRRLTVAIHIFAKGDTPDAAADSIVASVWTALQVAPDLGLGSAVQVEASHAVDWDFEEFDHVRATLRVTLNYRTATGAM